MIDKVIFGLIFLLQTSMAVDIDSDQTIDVEADDAPNEEDLYHHTTCLNLPDGEHYIRPIPDDVTGNYNSFGYLPSILVRCHDGWTILDYSLDANIMSYFSSFMQVHDAFLTMDVSKEHLNWDEWFKLNNVLFAPSDDCSKCQYDEDHPLMSKGYYMTGNFYGCAFATKALCDMDPVSLECYECAIHDTSGDEEIHQGLCGHVVLDIDNEHVDRQLTPHDKCTTYKWNYLPSVSTVGKWCTCFKPKDESIDRLVDALYFAEEEVVESMDEDSEDEPCESAEDNVYELHSSDFIYGTYRIRKCGTYKLMEDIALNFNAPPVDLSDNFERKIFGDLNDVDNLYWFPTDEQMLEEYPSHNFIGAYAMGFFAGISVEADNVIIDLNGYEIGMHFDFYLQQRFFSVIELASKPFISGQGPSNFGNTEVHYAENIVIQNGVIGLSSHHGIHGNNNKNVIFRDLHIHNFEVGGIAMNGFDTVTVHDVEIGPNYQNVPMSSMYTHARFMLQRLSYIPDKDNKYVTIGEVEYTANNIVKALQQEMNDALMFAYNEHHVEFDEDFEDLDEDYDLDNLYMNLDGLPHGGTLYGMFFNSYGAGVFGLGLAPGKSTNLHLKDIKIHDLRSNPVETVRYKLNRGPFNDLLDIKRIVDKNGKYKGTTYSDAQYTLHKLVPEDYWSVLGHTYIDDEIDLWIEHLDKTLDLTNRPDDETPAIKCNSDVMVHLTKGIFGIRLDNIDGLYMNGDIRIEKLHNLGELGEDELCGPYYSSKSEDSLEQIYPMQVGYTGTEVHGIAVIGTDGVVNNDATIMIDDIISARGSVYGINFYPNNNIDIHKEAKIGISEIHAGAYLSNKELQSMGLPNTLPRSCAIDVWNNKNHKDLLDDLNTNINFHGVIKHNYNAKCMTNHDKCSFSYSMIDPEYENDEDILNVDFLNEHIDNTECELVNEEDEFVGLQNSAKEAHQESLKYLESQQKKKENMNAEKMMVDLKYTDAEKVEDKFEQYMDKTFKLKLYVAVIGLIVITAVIVTTWKMCAADRKMKKMKDGLQYSSVSIEEEKNKNLYGTSPLLQQVHGRETANDRKSNKTFFPSPSPSPTKSISGSENYMQ